MSQITPENAHTKWMTTKFTDGTVHIWPVMDLIEHETENCLCGPTIDQDTEYAVLWVHHSLDGRERFEEKHES